jgi:hypothetical protein
MSSLSTTPAAATVQTKTSRPVPQAPPIAMLAKRRVGTGNHHEDRGMIEPTAERFARTITCEVVEGGAAQHGKQPGAVDRKAEEDGSIFIGPYHDRQNGAGSEAKRHADHMDHRVDAALGAAFQPRTRGAGARYDGGLRHDHDVRAGKPMLMAAWQSAARLGLVPGDRRHPGSDPEVHGLSDHLVGHGCLLATQLRCPEAPHGASPTVGGAEPQAQP